MFSLLVQGPAQEPVTLAEIRDDLKVGTDEDLLIASLITSARMIIEANAGVRLITQTWDVMFDQWPDINHGLKIPHWPVQQIDGVYLLGGTKYTVDASLYDTEITSRCPQILFKEGQTLPPIKRKTLGILVSLTAGFGDSPSDVPEPLKQAIRYLVVNWYEKRDWQDVTQEMKIPAIINTLIQPYKVMKL